MNGLGVVSLPSRRKIEISSSFQGYGSGQNDSSGWLLKSSKSEK
jgi:hypothetical protein